MWPSDTVLDKHAASPGFDLKHYKKTKNKQTSHNNNNDKSANKKNLLLI